jgi:hypothetical protein
VNISCEWQCGPRDDVTPPPTQQGLSCRFRRSEPSLPPAQRTLDSLSSCHQPFNPASYFLFCACRPASLPAGTCLPCSAARLAAASRLRMAYYMCPNPSDPRKTASFGQFLLSHLGNLLLILPMSYLALMSSEYVSLPCSCIRNVDETFPSGILLALLGALNSHFSLLAF